ncbi:unnamed protein product [Malus baccata var. baccata]
MLRGNQGNPNQNPRKQNTNRAVMGIKFQYLPKGLVVDILSRIVCVKTALNCKCVCKEWLSIISDPQFARLHLPRSPIGILMKEWHLDNDWIADGLLVVTIKKQKLSSELQLLITLRNFLTQLLTVRPLFHFQMLQKEKKWKG